MARRRRRTLKDAFSAGFLAGQCVIHAQSVFDQEQEYWKGYKRNVKNWRSKVHTKYTNKDLIETCGKHVQLLKEED